MLILNTFLKKMWPHHFISFLQSSDWLCLYLLQQYFLWMDFNPCFIQGFFFPLLVLEVLFKCKVTPQEWGVPKITAPQAKVLECGSFRDSSLLLGSCWRKSALYKSDKWEPPWATPMKLWNAWWDHELFDNLPKCPRLFTKPHLHRGKLCIIITPTPASVQKCFMNTECKSQWTNEGLWFPRQHPPCHSLLLLVDHIIIQLGTCIVYSNNWRFLGETYVGYLLGAGCSLNLCINLVFYLSRCNVFSRVFFVDVVSIFICVGLINIPIIKFFVSLWNILHQPSSISQFAFNLPNV
jgi:hypothetical protein